MTREDLEKFLERKGYQRDRWGHYHKTKTLENGEELRIRYKLQAKSLRLETHGGKAVGWIRHVSAFYSQLTITERDKLKGLRKGSL